MAQWLKIHIKQAHYVSTVMLEDTRKVDIVFLKVYFNFLRTNKPHINHITSFFFTCITVRLTESGCKYKNTCSVTSS